MKKPFTEQVTDVVRAAVGKYGTAYKLGQVSGVSKVNIGRWLGGTPPRTADVSPIMELMGASIVLPEDKASEYEFVPKVAALAGAGASLETSGETEGFFAFRKDWLVQVGVRGSSAVMLDVIGDSMEPVISDGDAILVDRSDREIRDGKVYLVTLGDELRVKRVLKGVSGLVLHSENPRYADIHVTGPDLEQFVVWGRVRWCGKDFK